MDQRGLPLGWIVLGVLLAAIVGFALFYDSIIALVTR
jgi:hypothetical protein